MTLVDERLPWQIPWDHPPFVEHPNIPDSVPSADVSSHLLLTALWSGDRYQHYFADETMETDTFGNVWKGLVHCQQGLEPLMSSPYLSLVLLAGRKPLCGEVTVFFWAPSAKSCSSPSSGKLTSWSCLLVSELGELDSIHASQTFRRKFMMRNTSYCVVQYTHAHTPVHTHTHTGTHMQTHQYICMHTWVA